MDSGFDPHPAKASDQALEDAQDLAAMGHEQALSRKFSIWSMSALAFCVLGTWSTFAMDLSSGLTNGGPITILWGLCLVTACNLCVAVSLGELTSSMPTTLGQAYWVYRLWHTPLGRFSSYMCAWINTFGWWTLTASQNAFMAEFLLDMKNMYDPSFSPPGWLQFVLYVAITLLFTGVNLVSCRREKILPWFNNFVGVCFVGLFFIFSLALLIAVGTKDHLSFQPASFAFGAWINATGWPSGVVWFTGLVQAAYGLTAFDSVIHMIEEIPAPRVNGPRVIWLAVSFGAVSGFIFMLICMFCIQDVNQVIKANLPFVDLVRTAIGLDGTATLIALFIFNGFGQGVSLLTTASRLTWGFARDGGIPWNRYLSHVDKTWHVPARALWFQCVIISVVGVLYLFSDTVLQAIFSVSTIALTISYATPIVALLVVGRDKLPPSKFNLGRFGVTANVVSIIYCAVTTVFFLFPGMPNPPPSSMNYAIAVFGVMLVISLGFWFLQGKRTYLNTEFAMADILQAEMLEAQRTIESVPQPMPEKQ